MTDSDHMLKTPNINFKSVTQHPGRYRLMRIGLNNQVSNQVTLDAASSSLLEFKLPAICYNLSKSYLSYNIELASAVGLVNWAHNSTLEIAQSIQFGTAGGINLVDLQYANNYVNTVRKIDVTNDQFLNGDVTSGLNRANLAAANYFPPTYVPEVGNIFGLTAGTRVIGSTEMEPQYARGGSNTATVLEIQRTFPLSGITNTLFSCPQDNYFGSENMYLRILTSPSGKVGYLASSTTDPTASAVVLATQPIVKNIFLYLAVEKDQLIIDSIMQKYNSGQLKFTIPFTYAWKNSTVGAGNSSIQVLLNSQYGKILKRMIHVVYPATETITKAYDHCNWSGTLAYGGKVSSYQTFLDSQPLQDFVLNCVQTSAANPLNVLDDYRENRATIQRSGAIMNPSSYQMNWFHCDQFTTPSIDPTVPDSQVLDGLDLSIAKSWAINLTTVAANFNHYTFGLFLRYVHIGPDGIRYE